MAPTANLNATSGVLTVSTGGSAIDLGSLGSAATLSTTSKTIQQLVVPTGTAGSIKVAVQMDGKTFEATSPSVTIEKSKSYNFNLSFSDSKMTMSTVSITNLTDVEGNNMKPAVPMTWDEARAIDGVYAIKSDGNPVAYANASDASYAGVAIVMYGRALQISNSQLTSVVWGDDKVNIIGIPDVGHTGGGVTGSIGYLRKPDGSYGTSSESYKIKADYTTWRNYPNTALDDTAGWRNTEALLAGPTVTSYLGPQTREFRNNSSVNQKYSDWFVPSAGQLAYMYLNMTAINTLLNKCGGTTLQKVFYWSSSEYSVDSPWYVYFSSGIVGSGYRKSYNYYVRFCRDITE